jgi:periplasmic copper chaperone A
MPPMRSSRPGRGPGRVPGRGRRARVRAMAIAAATAMALLALAAPAWAHIAVTPETAQAGSAAELTFRVPNEEAKANVTQVQMQIPTDHPIAQLLVKPVPGWTITVTTATLAKPVTTDDGTFSTAVSEVTWAGGTIAPGQYQDFSVSADPLPGGVSQLAFKAIQTYSNGDVVRWIDLPQAGQPEPEHPAPVLALTPAGAAPGPAATGPSNAQPNATETAAGTSTATWLGVAGLVAGLLGLATGVAAWRRTRLAAGGAGAPGKVTKGADREVSSR